MSISDFIKKAQTLLRQGALTSEAAVSQGIVLPALHALGWPVFDTSVVTPEYSVEGRRVDYALCNPSNRPVVFVEVKKTGLSEGADRQLFEYAFHKGVPILAKMEVAPGWWMGTNYSRRNIQEIIDLAIEVAGPQLRSMVRANVK